MRMVPPSTSGAIGSIDSRSRLLNCPTHVVKEVGTRLTVWKTIPKDGLKLPQDVYKACDIPGHDVKRGNGKSLIIAARPAATRMGMGGDRAGRSAPPEQLFRKGKTHPKEGGNGAFRAEPLIG